MTADDMRLINDMCRNFDEKLHRLMNDVYSTCRLADLDEENAARCVAAVLVNNLMALVDVGENEFTEFCRRAHQTRCYL